MVTDQHGDLASWLVLCVEFLKTGLMPCTIAIYEFMAVS